MSDGEDWDFDAMADEAAEYCDEPQSEPMMEPPFGEPEMDDPFLALRAMDEDDPALAGCSSVAEPAAAREQVAEPIAATEEAEATTPRPEKHQEDAAFS